LGDLAKREKANMNEMTSICFALKEYGQIGPKLFQQLMIIYGHPDNVFRQTAEDISAMAGISLERATRAVEAQYAIDKAIKQIEQLQTINIQIISFFDDDYPQMFRAISDPPLVIYLKGDSKLLDSGGVAIVGTTAADQDGLRHAVDFARGFAGVGKTVISGLAMGIDTAAHLGCIQNGGKTIAVLGCGHLNIYPEENTLLAGMIAESGAVISEYDIYADPIPGRLVSRNRLIAALAEVVLVVQIGENRKGELYAARAAAEQGKPVFMLDPDNRHDGHDILDDSYMKIQGVNQIDEIMAYMVR
jgi:DNA processing protein